MIEFLRYTGAMSFTCAHCCRIKSLYARGLCSRCYHLPGVTKLYPPPRRCVRSIGETMHASDPPPPKQLPEPTQALPGTEEKVEVLAKRVEAQQILWHPRDARRNRL